MGLKITCDICGKEDNECTIFSLPTKGTEYVKRGKGNYLTNQFTIIVPQEKYLCRDCGEVLSCVTQLMQAKKSKDITGFDITINFQTSD